MMLLERICSPIDRVSQVIRRKEMVTYTRYGDFYWYTPGAENTEYLSAC